MRMRQKKKKVTTSVLAVKRLAETSSSDSGQNLPYVKMAAHSVQVKKPEHKTDSSSDDPSYALRFPNKKEILQILMTQRNAERAAELSAKSNEDSSSITKKKKRNRSKSHKLST